MAKQQPQRPQPTPQPQAKKAAPAPARRSEKKDSIFNTPANRTLIFGKQNFMYMGIGLALVLLGLVAMSGGSMPDPNKWEPERIYSFRRITLAPIMIVGGLVAVIIGIFKKNNTEVVADNSDLYA